LDPEQVEEAGAAGVLVGLSGGIDSAVAAVLAKRALGEQLLSLLLPCHSLPEDERDAMLLVDTFKLRWERVDLARFMKLFCKDSRKPANYAKRTLNLAYE